MVWQGDASLTSLLLQYYRKAVRSTLACCALDTDTDVFAMRLEQLADLLVDLAKRGVTPMCDPCVTRGEDTPLRMALPTPPDQNLGDVAAAPGPPESTLDAAPGSLVPQQQGVSGAGTAFPGFAAHGVAGGATAVPEDIMMWEDSSTQHPPSPRHLSPLRRQPSAPPAPVLPPIAEGGAEGAEGDTGELTVGGATGVLPPLSGPGPRVPSEGEPGTLATARTSGGVAQGAQREGNSAPVLPEPSRLLQTAYLLLKLSSLQLLTMRDEREWMLHIKVRHAWRAE